ncbi:eukaryotic translation initiation factor 2D [Teleopsis dalmanni]|uniref:eukaryotic translation initiation factor 2D n=1 Tax=Teleopsis dalmanni TaxID=139649 RepID=UPI000D32B4C5|nr:eukaryotic translation initiation factor 2D [Teleopsis dalmanni]
MFLKPYKLKSNAPLKGSDVKLIKQRLEKSFSNLSDEKFQILIPQKSCISILKLITYNDFQTNVYCVNKLPMFFETEDNVLAPTLYAVWLVPDLLPYFTTFPQVLPKLSNGADLMLPGVIKQGVGMNMYGRYKKGQLVAVNLTSNKAAVGIGFLTRSSDDLYMCGGQGSAVKMLHIFGDKLWGHEPSLTQQIPNLKPSDLTNDDFPELGANTKRKEKPQEQSSKEMNVETESDSNTQNSNMNVSQIMNLKLECNNSEVDANNTDDEKSTLLTAEQILKNAFLAALKNHGKTLQLPLLTSNFFRLYVVPEAEQNIDIKKTKYKKLSNFLNEMIDQGFIVVREETKGVDKITFIDLEHPELVNFVTDFKKLANSTQEEQNQPLFHSELKEMYVVTDVTAPFFTKLNYKRGEGIPVAQVKKIVREYVNKQNLTVSDPITKSFSLDDTLQRICECTEANLNRICMEIINKMEHSYQMCSLKDISSNKPLIQMSLATRSGNKKVTLVSNLECYGIILPEFIKLCKQGAAASTTIIKLPNQKREQLQIQGNQVRFVYTLLTETYKVPAKCILGLELAKDGKKYKKK